MHRIHDLFEFRISDKFKAGLWLHIPIVCVAGKKRADTSPEQNPGGLAKDDLQKADDFWMQLQREHAKMSSRGELVVAEKSGHLMHRDQPEADSGKPAKGYCDGNEEMGPLRMNSGATGNRERILDTVKRAFL